MPVDVGVIFRRGGRDLINLLEYCVYSVQMDPLFLYLVSEYRLAPTTDKALALYELFCAADAPARISLRGELPPKDFRLPQALGPYFRTRQFLLDRAAMVGRVDATGGDGAASEPNSAETTNVLAGGGEPTEPDTQALPQNLMLLPPAYAFDVLRNALLAQRPCPLKRLGKQFDPLLTARENLLGGELNASQKFFTDFVWNPTVRPQLVAAGFRSVANVA